MFKSVVAALNEALDITLHLQPLRAHFKVCCTMLSQVTIDLHLPVFRCSKQRSLLTLGHYFHHCYILLACCTQIASITIPARG